MPFTFIRRRTPSEAPAAAPARRRVFTPRFFLDGGLFLGVYVLCLLGLAATSPMPYENLAEGQRAPATVVAQVDFSCRDWDTTLARRHQAAEEVRPVFSVRDDGTHEALRTISRLAERARLRRSETALAAAATLPRPSEKAATAAATAEQAPSPVPPAGKTAENALLAAESPAPPAETPSEPPKKRKKSAKDAEKPENFPQNAEKTARTSQNPLPEAPETAIFAENGRFLGESGETAAGSAVSALPSGADDTLPLPLPGSAAEPSARELLFASLADAASMLDVPLSGETLAFLFPADRETEVATVLSDALRQATASGIISPADRDSAFGGLVPARELALPAPGGGYRLRTLDSLPSPEEAALAFARAAAPELRRSGIPAAEDDLAAIVSGKLAPTLAYDPAATVAARAAAADRIAPATRFFRVGDTLMEERQRVTAQTLEILSAHAHRIAELESPRDRRRHLAGRALILLFALLLCFVWQLTARRDAVPAGVPAARRDLLLTFLALLTVLLALAGRALCASQAFLPMWLLPYLLPLAAPTILAVLFADSATALSAALWLGLTCDMVFGETGNSAIPAFCASASALLALRRVHKRSQIMRAGLLSGAVAALLAAAYAVMQRPTAAAVAAQAAAALAGGFLSGTLATLLLAPCEWMFGFTTGVTLLELTDAGHPLLRRLAVEAPGTYHHSLMVAALASAAAEKIGADALEVTVEAYFHDIGKLAKPEFFTENQRGGDNPHDQLAPAMSALVIQSHVKEGLSLAKRYRLPAIVRRAIASHHGTSLASFFYQIAKKEAVAAGLPESPGLEASFRYEGPRPDTKEHAILMLADGVEAASRSLEKPTPQHIRTLVERMTAARIADGQLDESPLSLKEIADIRESLVFSLGNMHHGRTPYPPRHPDRPAKKP